MSFAVAKWFCRLLHRLGACSGLLALERRLGRRRHAVVLLYHHIRQDDEPSPPLSEVEQGVSLATFTRHLDVLSRWYRPSAPANLHAALAGEAELAEDALIVTFDDGYLDNRTLAGPVLRQRQAPGLIFVATGYIGTSRRFWWVEINDVVRKLSAEGLARARDACNGSAGISASLQAADISSHARRRQFRARVAAALETLPQPQREAELNVLRHAVGRLTDTCLPLLNWDDMRQMQQEQFVFGAHTVTHPHLSRATSEEIHREISNCATTLQQELSARPEAFAYPHGDVDERVEAEVRRAGFQAAYAAHAGAATPGKTNRFRIPRIQLYADDPAYLAMFVLALKLSKYAPRLMRPVLSRMVGQPFEV